MFPEAGYYLRAPPQRVYTDVGIEKKSHSGFSS